MTGDSLVDVVAIGNMVADVVVRPVDAWPQTGQIRYVDDVRFQLGGNAVNTAVALSILGVRVSVAGRVGKDVFGDRLVDEMSKLGVDTTAVVRDDAPTAVTIAGVRADGHRSFLHSLGANANVCPDDIPWHRVEKAKIFHMSSLFVLPGLDGPPGARALARARESGVTTVLDMCWDASGRWMTLVRPFLPYADYFLPNVDEAEGLTGTKDPAAMADRLKQEGCGCVVIKLGEDGCYVREHGRSYAIPGISVTPVDSTGAGDAFGAGFMAALLKGWPVERAARFANAVGAMAVSAVGNEGLRSFGESLAWLEAHY